MSGLGWRGFNCNSDFFSFSNANNKCTTKKNCNKTLFENEDFGKKCKNNNLELGKLSLFDCIGELLCKNSSSNDTKCADKNFKNDCANNKNNGQASKSDNLKNESNHDKDHGSSWKSNGDRDDCKIEIKQDGCYLNKNNKGHCLNGVSWGHRLDHFFGHNVVKPSHGDQNSSDNENSSSSIDRPGADDNIEPIPSVDIEPAPSQDVGKQNQNGSINTSDGGAGFADDDFVAMPDNEFTVNKPDYDVTIVPDRPNNSNCAELPEIER